MATIYTNMEMNESLNWQYCFKISWYYAGRLDWNLDVKFLSIYLVHLYSFHSRLKLLCMYFVVPQGIADTYGLIYGHSLDAKCIFVKKADCSLQYENINLYLSVLLIWMGRLNLLNGLMFELKAEFLCETNIVRLETQN